MDIISWSSRIMSLSERTPRLLWQSRTHPIRSWARLHDMARAHHQVHAAFKMTFRQLSEYRKRLGMSELKNIYRKCQPKVSHKGLQDSVQRFQDSKITDIEVTLQRLKPWPNSVALAWHGSMTQVCDLFVKPSNNLPKQTSLMSKIYCINSNLEKWWHVHGMADIMHEISADFWFPNMPSAYDWVFGTKTSPVLKVKRMAWRATARATTSFT